MPTAVKKASSKASSRANATASKSAAATHPPWVDMIKEAITTHPEDARAGVSRPTIKKFIETKYHIDFNAPHLSQLNRAIAHGNEKGLFLLPKGLFVLVSLQVARATLTPTPRLSNPGPSGKVKLASKAKPTTDAAKEVRHAAIVVSISMTSCI
ncbi:hypothetical protein NLJ89_g12378 [Agrocybe chaxingu]|uniref:Histone H1 n=1 Tax=Agrocybe chaxingu TaxID=84603 RepID=A0A9W8JLZ5_9AGAR|nr:hypothetical protein NLJ89_g12378 [Agrocybe chaxingu]